MVENKATCKLCFAKVTHSGGTTNLQNHFLLHHHKEYKLIFGHRVTRNDQTKINDICKYSSQTTKLLSTFKRAQELTAAVVEFIVQDLKPMRIIDSIGFLHLMDVTEPRYLVPCCITVNNYLEKIYFTMKSFVQ